VTAGTRRTLVLLALAAAYAAAIGGVPGSWRARARFDPLAPRPHAVESLIVAGRYDEALPLVKELRDNYPGEPIVAHWLARVDGARADWAGAAASWEEYVRLSPSPLAACPDLPKAYDRLGQTERALNAYRRCVDVDPNDPERHLDLGRAYERAGRAALALACYRRAAALDPTHPAAAALTTAREAAEGAGQ
jgi:Flp pilus assembly protein TadD